MFSLGWKLQNGQEGAWLFSAVWWPQGLVLDTHTHMHTHVCAGTYVCICICLLVANVYFLALTVARRAILSQPVLPADLEKYTPLLPRSLEHKGIGENTGLGVLRSESHSAPSELRDLERVPFLSGPQNSPGPPSQAFVPIQEACKPLGQWAIPRRPAAASLQPSV